MMYWKCVLCVLFGTTMPVFDKPPVPGPGDMCTHCLPFCQVSIYHSLLRQCLFLCHSVTLSLCHSPLRQCLFLCHSVTLSLYHSL